MAGLPSKESETVLCCAACMHIGAVSSEDVALCLLLFEVEAAS